MHDIDRTLLEAEPSADEMGFMTSEPETAFTEEQELTLAGELLALQGDEELDQFLGSLIKKVGSAVGKVVNSPVGKAIGGVLKAAAKQALPVVGGALGNMVAPGLGGVIGAKLASVAGNAMGLELEGLGPEEREYEAARAFVRFAADAVKRAIEQAPGGDPRTVARQAALGAARRHAPGFLKLFNGATPRAALVARETDGETDELELASSLLEVTDEQGLDQFLGDLVKKAARVVGGIAKSPVGQIFKGYAKQVAKKLIPAAASAVGSIAGPNAASAAAQITSQALGALGLEAETLSPEDREYEVARRFVRFMSDAAKRALSNAGRGNPLDVVKKALVASAKQHAPGLLADLSGEQETRAPRGALRGDGGTNGARSGRWVRDGNRIVILLGG